MKQETIEKLKSFHMNGFVQALREQEESATYTELSFEERLSFLVDSEFLKRKNNRIAATIRFAKLKSNASIETLDYSAQRNLKKSLVAELADCNWVKKAQNIIITGPTGVGKSFLASALAEKACRLEIKTLHIKINELIRQIMLAHAEGTYPRLIAKFSRIPLLVIDEWLRNPLSAEQAKEILESSTILIESSSVVTPSERISVSVRWKQKASLRSDNLYFHFLFDFYQIYDYLQLDTGTGIRSHIPLFVPVDN